jgi:ABC-type nitrate/sulfonate/bicarbonate transport system substrate-binding protein
MEGTLNQMLRSNGVDPSTVNKVKVADVPASFGLIEAHRIDGFMASISSVVKIVAVVPDAVLLRIDDGIPGQVYVATPAAIAAHEDGYVRFLRAVHRSAIAILDAPDPKAIIKSIGSGFEVPGLDNVDASVSDMKQNAETWIARGRENLLRNVPDNWASAAKLMAEAKMIDKAVDPTTLYTNALRDKAVG